MTSVQGNVKLQCEMALGSKGEVSQKEEGREVRTQAQTRRVESGTTTTYASAAGSLASADPQQ